MKNRRRRTFAGVVAGMFAGRFAGVLPDYFLVIIRNLCLFSVAYGLFSLLVFAGPFAGIFADRFADRFAGVFADILPIG